LDTTEQTPESSTFQELGVRGRFGHPSDEVGKVLHGTRGALRLFRVFQGKFSPTNT